MGGVSCRMRDWAVRCVWKVAKFSLLFTCRRSSRLSMYSIAFRRISTFGSRWLGFVLVRRFSTSKASFTFELSFLARLNFPDGKLRFLVLPFSIVYAPWASPLFSDRSEHFSSCTPCRPRWDMGGSCQPCIEVPRYVPRWMRPSSRCCCRRAARCDATLIHSFCSQAYHCIHSDSLRSASSGDAWICHAKTGCSLAHGSPDSDWTLSSLRLKFSLFSRKNFFISSSGDALPSWSRSCDRLKWENVFEHTRGSRASLGRHICDSFGSFSSLEKTVFFSFSMENSSACRREIVGDEDSYLREMEVIITRSMSRAVRNDRNHKRLPVAGLGRIRRRSVACALWSLDPLSAFFLFFLRWKTKPMVLARDMSGEDEFGLLAADAEMSNLVLCGEAVCFHDAWD